MSLVRGLCSNTSNRITSSFRASIGFRPLWHWGKDLCGTAEDEEGLECRIGWIGPPCKCTRGPPFFTDIMSREVQMCQ